MYMSPKVHFKTLVEAFEKCKDENSRESMRDVLVKCRVFKMKDKVVKQEVEVDKLVMEVEEGNSNNSGKMNIGNGGIKISVTTK